MTLVPPTPELKLSAYHLIHAVPPFLRLHKQFALLKNRSAPRGSTLKVDSSLAPVHP